MPGFVQRITDFEREWERDAKTMKSNRTTAERFIHNVYGQRTNVDDTLNFGSRGLSQDDSAKYTQNMSSRGL